MRRKRANHKCLSKEIQFEVKTCLRCKEKKPAEAFGKDASTKDNLTRWCRPCRNEYQLDSQRRYREQGRYGPEYYRRTHLKHAYGITPERFDEMLAAQGGRCAVCPETEDFTVDHDHSCCPGNRSCGNCIRGILCRKCNMALGLLNDDPERLRSLANYLRVNE